jgi:4'-phosphopantetheinyl transferase
MNVSRTWSTRREPPPLDGLMTHVWRVSLDERTERHDALLTADEYRRADRFFRAADAARFVIVRATLRSLLSRYLGMEPADIVLGEGPNGKPRVTGIEFNVSHSEHVGLIAIGRKPVGVDVERIRDDLDATRLARRTFAPPEVAVLDALKPDARRRAFFTCWVRKEAWVKGTGKGLGCPLDAFVVSVDPEHPPSLLASTCSGDDITEWTLHDLAPGPTYAGALVVRAPAAPAPMCLAWSTEGMQ